MAESFQERNRANSRPKRARSRHEAWAPMKVSVLPASSVAMVVSMPSGSNRLIRANSWVGMPEATSMTRSRVWMAALLYTHSVPGSCCWDRSIENCVLSGAATAIST